ncbi:GTP-binding protein, partial [Cohnella sp. GbtcB17]|uniref:CobW family GTP-binding protein n=1 Tax=Cohnella sp. GbtcB17 TaxID=2824762 RepID=UPI001C2FFC61
GVSRTVETLIEMTHVCICCKLRVDLLPEVERLARLDRFDYILIESPGIGEPLPVAQTFSYIDEELGIDLTKLCRLDTMVTVVDANRFWHDYSSGETPLGRSQAAGDAGIREVSDLLVDQIEFCDVLLLNKCDMLDADSLDALERVLRALQPTARFIRTTNGKVDPAAILNTGSFDFERASASAGWIRELEKPHHTPETEEYGISSFVYERRLPFHPARLMAWMSEWPAEIVRAKGTLWLPTRHAVAQSFSQAGPSIQMGPAGWWIAALPDGEREQLLREEPELAQGWHADYGDRVNRLVLIGIDMDRRSIEDELDGCLLTDEELAADWRFLADPFPQAPGELAAHS